ncbi:MAG: 4Fe-4S binding protein [Synergistaceae bacterium]
MRKIIKINEKLCDGCGLCANACHEGAIIIKNGKAKLISESYCDGLGDCIGECPQGAITFEMKEALPYDEKAVSELKKHKEQKQKQKKETNEPQKERETELMNWPIQLKLAPEKAFYLDKAHLLIAADCAGFASPNLHQNHIKDRICLVGCPKLDDPALYVNKIATIIKQNEIKEIDILYMEVPCCSALVRIVKKSIELSGEEVTLQTTKISMKGKILEIIQNPK